MERITRIRAARKAKNISQSDLADLLDVRQDYISRIENGQLAPSVYTALRLAEILDETVESLFSPESSPSIEL